MKRKLTRSESGKLGGIIGGKIQKEQRKINIIEYNKNPKLCKYCNKALHYDKRYNKFCNHSCAASFKCNWSVGDRATLACP